MEVRRWLPLNEPRVQVNSDGAVGSGGLGRGAGFAVRGSDGSLLLAGVKHFNGLFQVDITEVLGILSAVQTVINQDFFRVKFESDCVKVINLINSNEVVLLELGCIIAEIKRCSAGRYFRFTFYPRSCNVVAHELTHFALSTSSEEI